MRALILLLGSACTIIGQPTGRIEGRVLTVTGEPIGNATVRLSGNSPQSPTYVELTASDGRFVVENLPPGNYAATAQRDGYTRAPNAAGVFRLVIVDVAAGETKTGVEIRLRALVVLSGTVTDPSGAPVRHPQLRLNRLLFNQGRLTLTPTGSVATGDDRGMFRLVDVEPGRYYLQASGPAVQALANEVRGRSAQETNLPTYYPSSPDARGAVAITVGTTEVTNLNIRLRRGGAYSMGGTLVGANGAPVEGAQITIYPKGGIYSQQGITSQVPTAGFLIGGVPTGDYTILVRSTPARNAATASPGAAAVSPVPPATVGRLDVRMGAANLEGLTIRMTEGVEINGRVTIEGGIDLATFMQPLSSVNLGVINSTAKGEVTVSSPSRQPRLPVITLQSLEGPLSQVAAQVNGDGTFKFEHLTAVNRVLQVTLIPGAAYVKSVRFRGRDVTRAPLDLSSGAGGALEIVMGTKGGEIIATPRTTQGEFPAGGAVVTVWPSLPDPGSLTGGVRFSGRQTTAPMPGLAPGDYFVAAWDTFNADYQVAPEFLDRFRTRATRVTVVEGKMVTAEPQIISREALEKEIAQFP